MYKAQFKILLAKKMYKAQFKILFALNVQIILCFWKGATICEARDCNINYLFSDFMKIETDMSYFFIKF